MANQGWSGLKSLPKLEHLYVCSDHFTEDCFEVDHRHNLLGSKHTKERKKQTQFQPFLRSLVPLKSELRANRGWRINGEKSLKRVVERFTLNLFKIVRFSLFNVS